MKLGKRGFPDARPLPLNWKGWDREEGAVGRAGAGVCSAPPIPQSAPKQR